jgi:predicted exporter
MTKTARDIQRPLLLGALTTAGAFAIFGTSSAPGLGQLACFTGAGILAAAVTLRWVIPHLAGLARIEPSPRTIDWLPARPWRGFTWLIVILGVAAVALLISRHDRLFETDVGVLNPLPEASKLLDQQLRSDLGAPDLRHLLLIEAKEVETVLRQGERLAPALEELREKGAITGFDSPARYLSSRALQERRSTSLPGADDLKTALMEAEEDLPFKAGLFDPFLKAVEDSRTGPALDGEQGLALFDATPLGARVSQLLLADDGRWYGFVPMSGVADVAGLKALADRTDGVELIDLKSLSEGVLSVFRDEAFSLLALGSGVILLLLAAFRYPLLGIARIFLVLALSIVITIALLSLAGE